jgi:BirA family biotin operon repressor/biotin-[acetyl-CoA-carboxylase] ligase
VTDALDAERIAEGLLPALRPQLRRVTVLEEVDSTNTELARLPWGERHSHALLAEAQTAGRGRGDRRWHSPPGGYVYLSLGWRFRRGGPDLAALPLAVAVALAETVAAAGLAGAGVKWPNDLLVDGRKLAGILVESQSRGPAGTMAVVGIGLNVRMPERATGAAEGVIDRPWTDLESGLPASRRPVDRNALVAALLGRLLAALERFGESGFTRFRARYERLDVLAGRALTLDTADGPVRGTGRGVDDSGLLRIALPGGDVRVFHYGEVRISGK